MAVSISPADPMQTINWKELPVHPHPKWYQSSQIRKSIAITTLALGILMTTAAVGLIPGLTRGIATVSALSLLSLCFLITSVVLARLKPSKNDPEYLLQKRQEAEAFFKKNPYPSYLEIRSIFPPTVFSDHEINCLLVKEIETLSYRQFIKKHTRQVVSILNDANKKALKARLFSKLFQEKGLSLAMILRRSQKALALTDSEKSEFTKQYYQHHATRLKAEGAAYSNFKAFFKDLQVMEALDEELQSHFIKKWRQEVLEAEYGLLSLQTMYSEEMAYFKKEITDSLRYEILEREIEAFATDKQTYLNLKLRNGSDAQMRVLNTPALKEQARLSLLKEPLQRLYLIAEPERQALGITLDVLKETLQKKWEHLSFANPFTKEVEEVFFSLEKGIFAASDWTQRALSDTQSLSIRELLQTCRGFFELKILTAKAQFNGKTIQERLQEEIAPIESWENLLEAFSEEIFTMELIEKEDPKIAALVGDYISRNPSVFITQNFEEDPYAMIIAQFDLIPSPIREQIETASDMLEEQKQALSKRLEFLQIKASTLLSKARMAYLELCRLEEISQLQDKPVQATRDEAPIKKMQQLQDAIYRSWGKERLSVMQREALSRFEEILKPYGLMLDQPLSSLYPLCIKCIEADIQTSENEAILHYNETVSQIINSLV